MLVSPQIRAAVQADDDRRTCRNLVVLSYNEITRDTKIESVAMVADVK